MQRLIKASVVCFILFYSSQIASQVDFLYGSRAEPAFPARAGWSAIQKKAEKAIVQIVSQTAEPNVLKPYRIDNGEGRGSGFLISDDGKILTNYHVVAGAVSVMVQMPLLFGKKMIEVKVKGVCPERDIALLQLSLEDCKNISKVNGSVPFLTLGTSAVVDRSDELLALGFPLGQESLKSVTGVVSGQEHITITSGGRLVETHCIQVSTPINPGNSGGPVLDVTGKVVGIVTAGVSNAQNVGYITPIEEYYSVQKDIEIIPLVKKPFLGGDCCLCRGDELAIFLGNPLPAGCYIKKVYPYGWLHEAGFCSGDMIYTINGFDVDAYGHLTIDGKNDRLSIADYIASLPLGYECIVVLYRNGVKHTIVHKLQCPKEPAIRWKYFKYDPVDYEIIGGVLLQDLSLNIINFFSSAEVAQHVPGVRDYLSRYNHNEIERTKGAVIVTQIFSSSAVYKARSVGVGEVITEINGVPVSDLAQVREAIINGINSPSLTLKTCNDDLVVLDYKEVLMDEIRLAQSFNYVITPLTARLMKTFAIAAGA